MKPRGLYLHKNGSDVVEIRQGWLAKTMVGAILTLLVGWTGIGLTIVVSDHYAIVQMGQTLTKLETRLEDRVKWGEAEHREIRNDMRSYELKEDHRRDIDDMRRLVR